MTQPIGLARLEIDRLRDRAMTLEVQLDDVLTRFHSEALGKAVEIVDGAGEIPIDVHLGGARRHLHARRAATGIAVARTVISVVAMRPAPRPPPPVVPERIVKGRVPPAH